MTATNHTITGALLAVVLPKPLLVLPLVFVSHFILDALPHFAFKTKMESAKFTYYLATDFAMAAAFLLFILLMQPQHWLLLVAAGITSASPDLMWLPKYLRALLHKPTRPLNKIQRLHSSIQWFERPLGIVFELPWFLVSFSLFLLITAKV